LLTCLSLYAQQYDEEDDIFFRDEFIRIEFFEDEIEFDDFNDRRTRLRTIFSTLQSFLIDPDFFTTNDSQYHIMIVIILILEHACISYLSSSRPSYNQALAKACSQYRASQLHNVVTKQLPTPLQDYSVSQFTEFILGHRF